MTIQRCFALVQERWRTALLTSLLVLAAAAAAIWVQTPVYQASASVFVRTGASGDVFDRTEASDYAVQRITTYADLATSPLVLDPVIEALDLHTDADSLASVLTVQIPEDSLLLTISAEDTDPEQAARIANLVAASLRTEVSGLESVSGPSPIHLTTVAPALPPEHPARPDLPLLLGLALLAAVAAGIAVALVRGTFDDRVRDPKDLAALTERPQLASIPEARSGEPPFLPLDDVAPQGRRAEALRGLRTTLRHLGLGTELRTLLVTSAVHGEGATSIALDLASTLAREGHRTLLIDADLRGTWTDHGLGLGHRDGLSTALRGGSAWTTLVQPTALEGLSVLAGGPRPQNPGALLDSFRMTTLLRDAADRYDIVLIDAPPVLALSDSTTLAQQVSGTLLVAGSGRVRSVQLSLALRKLQLVDADALGIVLNRVPRGDLETYYELPPEATTAGAVPGSAVAAGAGPRTGRRRRTVPPGTDLQGTSSGSTRNASITRSEA